MCVCAHQIFHLLHSSIVHIPINFHVVVFILLSKTPTRAAKIEEIANLWNEVLSMKETNDELDTDSTTMNEEMEK